MPRSGNRSARILGVDPGTLITGYGVVEPQDGRMRIIASGSIRNREGTPMCDRLDNIYRSLETVIRRHSPDEMAIETAFYGRNAQSALKLGHARGVSILAAVRHRMPVHEYSPREVKKAITGTGTATKQQVQFMVMTLLRIPKPPELYDITDALAVAVTHLHRQSISHPVSHRSWKAFLAAHPERVMNGGTV